MKNGTRKKPQSVQAFDLKRAGTKLNTEELTALENHCRDRARLPERMDSSSSSLRVGAWERRQSATTRSLAEVLGVRLLLVNVLRPLAAGQKLTSEAFDKLLDEISAAKHELAGKLASREGDNAMAKTTWGRKETIIWPRHMPIYTYSAVFAAVVLTGVFLCVRIRFGDRRCSGSTAGL